MKLKYLLASSVALAAIALTGCQDKDLQMPVEGGDSDSGVKLTIGLAQNAQISRAEGDAETPFREIGDPNENMMHNVHVIITTAPINSGNGQVLKVISRTGITDAQNLNRYTYETKDKWIAVDSHETPLYWYDNDGTAHSVYTDNQGFRAYIASMVQFNNDRELATEVEDLISYVTTQEDSNGGTPVQLYATALANVDLKDFVNASGVAKTIAAGMNVSELRDLIYVGELYHSNYGLFPYDPNMTSTKFPWGPTGYAGGEVRFTDFAMSSVNEVKFHPEFDANGNFTFPTMVVQRMAARIDIAFGVQAVDRYSAEERNNKTDRTNMPYITDRGWFYVGTPAIVNGKVTYPNADSNPNDGKTGPDLQTNAPFEKSFGAGFVGLVDCIDDPGDGYIAKYLYDMDVTGDDYTTGAPVKLLDIADFDGVARPVKWGGEVMNGEEHLTVTYDSQERPISVEGYDNLPQSVKENLQYHYEITNQDDFQTKNYAGQYRFPIYDEAKYLAGEGDVLITGAVFYMQSIRLLNCTNTGVYLYEQANVNNTRLYLHNEGDWQRPGNVSYPSHFIYSTPMERRSFTDRQLTTLADYDHRPVPCIQSGLKVPNSSRTLYSPKGDKRWGVYSILGYVGENTFDTYSPNNNYTGMMLEGVTNLGHYFQDTEQLVTNDGNLRTRVKVEMKLCHSFGGGASNIRGDNMHFATVRNTVYRVYVKFYAAGETMYVRYYFYDGSDSNFKEIEYEKADFYSNILEDDRYRPVVD